MTDAKKPNPMVPDLTKASELTRMLDAAALGKGALGVDTVALTKHWADASRALRLAEQHVLPGKELMRHMDVVQQFHKQWEVSPISKMMADFAAHKPAMDLLGASRTDLLGKAALAGLTDWASLSAATKFALPDRDMARYASFLGEASKFQDTWKALGIGPDALTSKALLAGIVPELGIMDRLTKSLANTVDPIGGAFKSAALWEGSLASRMASIDAAWARPDSFGVSMLGFARLSRLSDAVHRRRAFGGEIGELLTDELGRGADPADGATSEARDAAAIEAGLNPDLIAFPEPAYGEVIFAAGFHFRLQPTPVPRALEAADSSAAFDANHSALLNDVEQRLRQFVEAKLSALAGAPWVKQRVAEAVRKRWSERQAEERDAGRPVYGLVQYADFMDLADVIGQSNNWKDAFGGTFRNKEDLQVSLRRLHPVRKAIAHGRPLGRADVLTLVSEATRLLRALGVNLLP